MRVVAVWSKNIIFPVLLVFGVIGIVVIAFGIVVGYICFVIWKVVASFRNDAMKLVRSASRSML